MKKILVFTSIIIISFFIFSFPKKASADYKWDYIEDTRDINILNRVCGTGKIANADNCKSLTKLPNKDGFNTVCCFFDPEAQAKKLAEQQAALNNIQLGSKLPDYVFQIPIGILDKLIPVDCSSGTCEIPFLAQYITAVYKYGLSIAGILGVLILMAAGLLWMASGGNNERISQAKKMIFGSITGLILLVGLIVFLSFINPDLAATKILSLPSIKRMDILSQIAQSRNGATAESFKNLQCATDDELKNGIEFYATGYYKPSYTETSDFFCVIAMQCSCPAGQDTTKTCDIYKKTYPNYHPCKEFSASTPYCNMTSSGTAPKEGDVAGPPCSNLPKGTKICFAGKTYTITDSGGGIKGRRIDIWSGSDLNKAYSNTGVGTLTIGACK